MSGHSKWSTIKHKKGAADAKRGQMFTKLGRAIAVAAREGGGDPEMNFALRLAVDKARQASMPSDNIERAIKRGTGELEGEGQLEKAVYGGYGPGGIAFAVDVLTDNKNLIQRHITSFIDLKEHLCFDGPKKDNVTVGIIEERTLIFLSDSPIKT